MKNLSVISSDLPPASDVVDSLSTFHDDPSQIVSLPPLDPSRQRLIQLLCAPSESPDQLRALIMCRNALQAQPTESNKSALLTTKQIDFLTSIWDGLTTSASTKDPAISSLMSTCFLLDRLILSPDILSQIKSNPSIVDFLQSHMLSEDNELHQKYVYHILRTIRDPEQCPAWQTFFVIYDTLSEKQSHLILPVLDLLERTSQLPDGWHEALLAHSLSCNNSLVTKRIVKIILGADAVKGGTAGELVLQERFLQALNTTSLYDQSDANSISSGTLKKYFESDHINTAALLENISRINWKTVPFLHLCESLSETLSSVEWTTYLQRFAEHALKLPNVLFRNAVLRRLEVAAVARRNGRDRELFNTPVLATSHRSQKNHVAVMRSVTEMDVSKYVPSVGVSDEWVLDEVLNRVSDVIGRYYPALSSIPSDTLKVDTAEVVRTITKEHVWMHVLDEDVLQTLETMGVSRELYFSSELSCLVAAVVCRLLARLEWSRRFVEGLMDYELQMALLVLVANVTRVPVVEWTDLLDSCLHEIQSGKQTHLVASFLYILDELKTQDPSLDALQRNYYERVIALVPKHPKWMPIVTSHESVWQFVALDSDFMFDALTFGQHFKGDQLIEQRHLLEFTSCPDDAVRSKALKQVGEYDIDSLDALRRRCTDRLQELHLKKPRYYANSETHRLKLRLVQVLAIVAKRSTRNLPGGSIGIEQMLLDENNQLNVTYIAEIIVVLTSEPDSLIKWLRSATTPNARRSVMMCIYYSSLDHLTLGDTDRIAEYIQAISVLTMGKDYTTRLYAQITIEKLVGKCQLKSFEPLVEAIGESLRQDEHPEIVQRVRDDFRFDEAFWRNCDDLMFVSDIPRITGMCSLDIISWEQWLGNKESLRSPLEVASILPAPKESLVRTELIELNVGNVQKKIVPLKELFPDVSAMDNERRAAEVLSKSGLIVVASLITRPANLGGLSRTCEIFGAEKLVLDSLRHREHAEFQALSMTSEKWLRIAEVKPFHLVDYLVEMKRQGYTIIGAEQTANGITINRLKFPKKSVLLLGHEKEGIPANLLSLLDYAVEIPQFGVVRSLNVHVTGALFIWEYAKQHNAFV